MYILHIIIFNHFVLPCPLDDDQSICSGHSIETETESTKYRNQPEASLTTSQRTSPPSEWKQHPESSRKITKPVPKPSKAKTSKKPTPKGPHPQLSGSGSNDHAHKQESRIVTPPPPHQQEKRSTGRHPSLSDPQSIISPSSSKPSSKNVWRGQQSDHTPLISASPSVKASWEGQSRGEWASESIEGLSDVMSSATDDDKLSKTIFT